MNWLKKTFRLGEKIRKIFKKRPTKDDIENSDWVSCCKGPINRKELEENLWVCKYCGKNFRISCIQRFDIFFGQNRYEILKTPMPSEDPLNFESYKDKILAARKKTVTMGVPTQTSAITVEIKALCLYAKNPKGPSRIPVRIPTPAIIPKYPLYNHSHPSIPIAIGTTQGGITITLKADLPNTFALSKTAPINPIINFKLTEKNIQMKVLITILLNFLLENIF